MNEYEMNVYCYFACYLWKQTLKKCKFICKPTSFTGVRHTCEKFYERNESILAQASPTKNKLFNFILYRQISG